eukprot:scaffold1827_cov421-Prasinococcus_capsulatus_cf.AAC.40
MHARRGLRQPFQARADAHLVPSGASGGGPPPGGTQLARPIRERRRDASPIHPIAPARRTAVLLHARERCLGGRHRMAVRPPGTSAVSCMCLPSVRGVQRPFVPGLGAALQRAGRPGELS